MLRSIRRLSSRLPVTISPEISQALNDKVPVVALESTIITHGFPYPQNLTMARKVEAKIRENGGVPATCAFINGIPYVGLSDSQLVYLAEQKNVNKVSRRDIGVTMAQKLNGGTTIAGTMILSHIAGIQVFATGGLGGVHRDGHITMDVSADLTELSRTPVTVVCAGPKLILDIPRTMEYLETQGVFVGTYNDNGRANVEVPGFFCRNSGVLSPYLFLTFSEIASIVHHQNNVMKLDSGSLVCIPPPEDIAMSSEFIDKIIEGAICEADAQGIRGKALTPFLLKKIAQDTEGKSVECNMKFVMNNAEAGTKIAAQLLEMEKEATFQPSTGIPRSRVKSEKPKETNTTHEPSELLSSENVFRETESRQQIVPDVVDTIIIGLVALDTISSISGNTIMNDSNPGTLKVSVGGVGYNVSVAHKYGLESQFTDGQRNSYRFVSAVGDDLAGRSILSQMVHDDVSGIAVLPGKTAQYTAILDSKGGLVVACADMTIMEQISLDHLANQISRAQPKFVVVDCNLLHNGLNAVIQACSKLPAPARVIVDPTSSPKLTRIGMLDLPVYPNCRVHMATPTVEELGEMYGEFRTRGKFDDYDGWFPVLDALGLNSQFRDRMDRMAAKNANIKWLLEMGVLQQSFQLLPYIPNILVKLGSRGCVLVQLCSNVTDYKSVPTTSPYAPVIMCLEGREVEGAVMGAVVQYYDIPPANQNLNIVDVTGAGDTFVGYLTSSLGACDFLTYDVASLEQEWGKWHNITKSQLASGMTLESHDAVSPKIATIEAK